jgi:hypothetical protein
MEFRELSTPGKPNHRYHYEPLLPLFSRLFALAVGALGAMGQSSATAPGLRSADVVAVGSLSAPISPVSRSQIPLESGASKLREILSRTRNAARPGIDPPPASIEQEIADLETYTADNPESPYTPGIHQALAELHRNRGRYSQGAGQLEKCLGFDKGVSGRPG